MAAPPARGQPRSSAPSAAEAFVAHLCSVRALAAGAVVHAGGAPDPALADPARLFRAFGSTRRGR